MKLLCSQEELLKSVQIAVKALSTKSTLPILSGVLLETRDDELYCLATDLEIGIEVKIPEVTIIVPGRVVIPGKTFYEIIRHLSPGRIEMGLDESEKIFNINSIYSVFQLHVLPAEEFPSLPEGFHQIAAMTGEELKKIEENSLVLKVKGATLREAIRQSIYATLPEDPRPFLSSVLMEINPGRLRLVATDINRLVVKEVAIGSDCEGSALVPVKTFREIAQIFGNDPEEEIRLILYQRQLYVVGRGIILSSRLIDSKYPRYEQVIPTDFAGRMIVNRQVFLSALDRGSLLDKAVKLSLSEAGLIISANDPELGMAHEEINCDYRGEDLEIGFNAQFLMDFLRSTDEEEIIFNFSSGMKASLLRPGKGEDYRYIVMPLRLSV